MRDYLVAFPMISWPLFVLAMVLPFVRFSARAEHQAGHPQKRDFESHFERLGCLATPIGAD